MTMTAETHELAAKRIRALARAAAFERGPAMTFDDIAKHAPGMRARFIAEQAELAGFPVWTSAPDEAWRP